MLIIFTMHTCARDKVIGFVRLLSVMYLWTQKSPDLKDSVIMMVGKCDQIVRSSEKLSS